MVSFGAEFGTRSGRPLSYRNLARDVNGRLHRAGAPNTRFHDLRHTAVTPMLPSNVPVKVVSARLGRADNYAMHETHNYVLPTMGEEAAAKMHRLAAQ